MSSFDDALCAEEEEEREDREDREAMREEGEDPPGHEVDEALEHFARNVYMGVYDRIDLDEFLARMGRKYGPGIRDALDRFIARVKAMV
jgi:hypothetical protein